MDESHFLEEIRNWGHPPWWRSRRFSWRIRRVSFTQNDSFPDAGEGMNDFWSMSGNFKYRHHVEPRVKLYSPREESCPIPLKYIDVSRTTHTNLDVMQERASTIIGTSMGQEICLDIQARSFMARTLDEIGKKCEGEAETGNWKNQSSIMLEDYEESTSLTQRTRSSKKLLGMQEKWKHQWNGSRYALPDEQEQSEWDDAWQIQWDQIKTCVYSGSWWIYKTAYGRIFAESSWRSFCRKGSNIIIWYTNLFLCLKPWRVPQQRQQWIKNGRNWKRFRRGTWRKRWSMKQGRGAQKFILPH